MTFQVGIEYLNKKNKVVEQVQPGANITVKITADPESECHVLAVDKSVLLLKTGNDIEPQQV